MRFCIPSETKGGLEDKVGYHFGRVPVYTIYDSDTEKIKIVKNTSTHRGGIKLPAELLNKYEVNVMICGGLGRRAIQLFEKYGIEVYEGAQGTIKDVIEQFKQKKLALATDKTACKEHQFRKKEHNDHHSNHH
ncbi:MAG: NifB/NifX family molybdenum-iron cluster-binding protein [Candidatus Hodarchaeales archaeon]|jgi:predicted Fe-Mo cluster-binding NifX family protein